MANKQISETELNAQATDTLNKLKAQKRIPFTIMPDGSGDKKIAVKINGTRWEFWVGRMQWAPEDVYALIETKYQTLRENAEAAEKYANVSLGKL